MINSAVIMGRLTANPELKTTTNGVNVTNFTVAVNRQMKNKDGTYTADFINVVAWRGTADFVTKYFRKGSMIAVQGSIQTRNYEDRNGNKRTAVEILASNVSFCGSKNDNNNTAPSSETALNTPTPSFSNANAEDFEMLDGDDELPF